jgi:hypothetical protein
MALFGFGKKDYADKSTEFLTARRIELMEDREKLRQELRVVSAILDARMLAAEAERKVASMTADEIEAIGAVIKAKGLDSTAKVGVPGASN